MAWLAAAIGFGLSAQAQVTNYVALTGSDSNPGTLAEIGRAHV